MRATATTAIEFPEEPLISAEIARLRAAEAELSARAARAEDELRAIASKVALVLLDVSMPGLPRRELRRRLNELTRAPVVYFTGYALDAAGADAND